MYLIKSLSIFLLLVVFNQSILAKKSKIISLDEDNWDSMMTGEWMVEFFAPWCPACKALNPIWQDFADWSKELDLSVGQVDVTTSPELSGRFMVTALPTIFHIKNGVFRQYRGSRELEEFMTFIEEKKWEGVEEISAWKNPSTLQMAVVAKLFKLSMVLRSVHSTLTEEYGVPSWASYILYAIVTIVTGALLGLVLVCVIDFMFPPAPLVSVAAGKKSDEEDLEDDEEKKKSDAENSNKESESKSNSDEAEKSTDEQEPQQDGQASDSPTIRKRKPRKAD